MMTIGCIMLYLILSLLWYEIASIMLSMVFLQEACNVCLIEMNGRRGVNYQLLTNCRLCLFATSVLSISRRVRTLKKPKSRTGVAPTACSRALLPCGCPPLGMTWRALAAEAFIVLSTIVTVRLVIIVIVAFLNGISCSTPRMAVFLQQQQQHQQHIIS